MRIVNVIVIKENVVFNIKSFGVDETKSESIVEEAEKEFEEQAKQIGMTENDFDDCLEDGYFENQEGESVCLTWSEI